MDASSRVAGPRIVRLGDAALLVRFGDSLSDAANARAIAFARRLDAAPPAGMVEIDPNLVSVLVRFDSERTSGTRLAGELAMLLAEPADAGGPPATHAIAIAYGGADGPDLDAVAAACGLGEADFIARHAARPLRVLTTGFAPGFVYCGFHESALTLPRRDSVRDGVPAGAVLFAAGQTAIAATPIRTGWHVIGRTGFRNFDPAATPPTRLREGDLVRFVPA